MKSLRWIATVLIALPLLSAPRELLDGVAAMGDSLTDEYEFSGLSAARNWVEQLVNSRSVNFGPLSAESRGEPRRNGYEYNWARSGATTGSLLLDGQHIGAAGQVASGKVTLAYLGIGANDLGRAYAGIYTGLLSGGALDAFVNAVAANHTIALDTVSRAGQVKMVIGSIPDYGVTPLLTSLFPNAENRQRVTEATAAVNNKILAVATSRGIPVVDLFGIVKTIFAEDRRLVVGGLDIDLTTRSEDPHSFFLPDGIHPGTVAQGLLANAFMHASNVAYGAGLSLRSDQEILQGAGVTPPPGPPTFYDVGRFVIHRHSGPLLFAHVPVGGGYTTVFMLANTGAAAVSGHLILTDKRGNPFWVSLAGPALAAGSRTEIQGATFPVSVPPGGSSVLVASAPRAATGTRSGWARMEMSSGSLGGVATLQLAEEGVLKSLAGVLASAPAETASIPVDNDAGRGRFTGFAVANYNNEDINLRLVTLNEDGSIADILDPPELNPLTPQNQVARFLHEIARARLNFRGSLSLVERSDKKFAAVALVQNQGLVTAVPVVGQIAPHVPK